jgi:hypothetical protein
LTLQVFQKIDLYQSFTLYPGSSVFYVVRL